MGALRRWWRYRTCLTSHSDPATTATATRMARTADMAMATVTPMALGTTAGPMAMATRTARTMAAMAAMLATPMALATAMATHMPPPMAPTAVAMDMATPMAAPTAATATAMATPIPPTMAAATAMATPMAVATTTRCSSLFVRHEAQLGDRSVGSPRAQLARQWSIV